MRLQLLQITPPLFFLSVRFCVFIFPALLFSTVCAPLVVGSRVTRFVFPWAVAWRTVGLQRPVEEETQAQAAASS